MSVQLAEKVLCYKFGITNKHPSIREKQLNYGATVDVSLLTYSKFEVGSRASAMESEIKGLFREFLIDKDIMPDGYTETFPTHMLEQVINYINK
jgi:hypothetical protein